VGRVVRVRAQSGTSELDVDHEPPIQTHIHGHVPSSGRPSDEEIPIEARGLSAGEGILSRGPGPLNKRL
jgi:hypothetical protein